MEFYSGQSYHVYNQGNNKEQIFFEERNYLFFLKKMKKHLLPYSHILAWCLMPNHFHWLIKVKDNYSIEPHIENISTKVDPLNRSIGSLQSSYTRAINNSYHRTGSLFRTRTKAKNLSGNRESRAQYGLNCFLYIHQNPLRAGLVTKLENWEYSSFRDYNGSRNGSLCNQELGRNLFNLPKEKNNFYELSYKTVPEFVIRKIY